VPGVRRRCGRGGGLLGFQIDLQILDLIVQGENLLTIFRLGRFRYV
jgi:hypothetical protein